MSELLFLLTSLVIPLTWCKHELVSLLWFVVRPPSTLEITWRAVTKKQHPTSGEDVAPTSFQSPFYLPFLIRSDSIWLCQKPKFSLHDFLSPGILQWRNSFAVIKTCSLVFKSLRNISGISAAASPLRASSNVLERLLAHHMFLDVLGLCSQGNPLAFTLGGSSLLPR